MHHLPIVFFFFRPFHHCLRSPPLISHGQGEIKQLRSECKLAPPLFYPTDDVSQGEAPSSAVRLAGPVAKLPDLELCLSRRRHQEKSSRTRSNAAAIARKRAQNLHHVPTRRCPGWLERFNGTSGIAYIRLYVSIW